MGKNHDHHHHHSHNGGHHHHHHHGGDSLKRMKGALWLNLGFAIFELIGGFYFNSVAIMSDALHDFGDAAALGFAVYLEKYSQKSSNAQYTYGYRRFSVLGALLTGLILLLGSAFILMEAVPRLFSPQSPHAEGMILMALLGVAVNGFAAYKVSHGTSLNEKMLMWHMLEDLVGWVLVLIGGLIIKFTDVPQIDAALAIILSLWIIYNVFKNMKQTLAVFLMATPHGRSKEEAEELMKKNPLVKEVHHLHIWSLDGEKHILTTHVVVDQNTSWQQVQELKHQLKEGLKEIGILEATIEVETSGAPCFDPEHS